MRIQVNRSGSSLVFTNLTASYYCFLEMSPGWVLEPVQALCAASKDDAPDYDDNKPGSMSWNTAFRNYLFYLRNFLDVRRKRTCLLCGQYRTAPPSPSGPGVGSLLHHSFRATVELNQNPTDEPEDPNKNNQNNGASSGGSGGAAGMLPIVAAVAGVALLAAVVVVARRRKAAPKPRQGGGTVGGDCQTT